MAVQGNRTAQVEPSDPLFVHPSDNPAQPLVSNVFNGDNFDNWKRSVEIALSARHKLPLINGNCPKPDANSPLITLWQRNNAMVLSWLLNSLSENIRNSVLYFNTAEDLWKDLEGRFGQSNKARLFQVQKDVSCLSQGDMDIASYYTKARQLWDESSAVGGVPMCTCAKCECGVNGKLHNYTEEQRLIQFLMGLNPSYTAVRGNILMMSPFPSMSQAYSLLVQEERQRQVKSDMHFLGDNTSLSATTTKSQATLPQGKPDTKRLSLFCDHCKRTGHTVEKCYRLHGFPDKVSGRGKSGYNTSSRGGHFQTTRGGFGQSTTKRAYHSWSTSQLKSDNQNEAPPSAIPGLSAEQSKQLLEFISHLTTSNQNQPTSSNEHDLSSTNMAGIKSSSTPAAYICNAICCMCKLEKDAWIIDSGASDHMTFDANVLHDLQHLTEAVTISLPTGQTVQVTQYGKFRLNEWISLQHVLLVPLFKYNLLSVKKLTAQLHCSMVFSDKLCTLQGPSLKRPLAVGKEFLGLYILDKGLLQQLKTFPSSDLGFDVSCNNQSVHSNASTVSCNKSDGHLDFSIWHMRMGHIPKKRMSLLPVHIVFPKEGEIVPCDVCPKAKQQRLPFPMSTISTSMAFELIHVDTWGPYHVKAYSGHRYFLTIVDDYTRITWTHLMVTKDEAIPLLISFVKMAHTQFDKVVKMIRSDNALELSKSSSALEFFASNGIIHQTSCVQTPQQNGVVERKHKHLLEVARALLFQGHLPLRFWGDCVLTATHLINRLPTPLLQNKTPFEMLYGRPPSYTHLRVFGCLCYVSTHKQGRDKFQPRAMPCLFLGYPCDKKAYKVMDLKSHKIFTSRDIIFHETVFPFEHSPSTSLFPLPPSPTFSEPFTPPSIEVPPPGSNSSYQPSSSSSQSPLQSSSSSIPAPSTAPRKSTRPHRPPSYLQDYIHTVHANPATCFATLTNLSLHPPCLPSHCLSTAS